MDIQQFFTDINIHNKKAPKHHQSISKIVNQAAALATNSKFQSVETDISNLYKELKHNFDKDTLRLPSQQGSKLFDKYMHSSRIIRFPKIFRDQNQLQINTRRKRQFLVMNENPSTESVGVSKDEVFVIDRSPTKKTIQQPAHNTSSDLAQAIELQLKGRSQSTSKVVITQRRKPSGDYVSLTKQYRSKVLVKEPTGLSMIRNGRRFSIPEQKIFLENTIDVYGPRLHANRQSQQIKQGKQLPQIAPHPINPRVTRHGYSNDPAAMQSQTISISPLGGKTIHMYMSPQKMHPQRSLPLKQSGPKTPKKYKPKRVSVKDLKMEFQPLLHQDFIRLIHIYNHMSVRQNRQGMYKAFIGQGNNSVLIKKTLKARGYWNIVDTIQQDTNFVWTQLRNNKFFEKLQPRTIEYEDLSIEQRKIYPLSPLTKEFTSEKVHQSNFLEVVEAILPHQIRSQYFSNLINTYLRKPKGILTGKKLPQFVQLNQPIKLNTLDVQNSHAIKMHNHVDSASAIGNKKGLLFFMKRYYTLLKQNPFEVVPETIHLSQKIVSQSFLKDNITFGLPCILKPGECTNRGQGITVHTSWTSLNEAINKNTKHSNGQDRTHIIQRYVMPFLYNNRKFDIRVWVLWSGRQAWWYKQGYIRTSSKEFSLKSCSKFVHLTNDAIQKYSEEYGKYEPGNKLSFNEFQRYLDNTTHGKLNFWQSIYPEMKRIAKDIFRVGHFVMDSQNKMFGYELFGLDFMIDQNFKVWLIEANTNPCLETSCSILTRLITNMIDNVISIAVDPLFPPPSSWKKRTPCWTMQTFKFELIYNGFWQTEKLELDEQVKFEDDNDEFEQKQETQAQ